MKPKPPRDEYEPEQSEPALPPEVEAWLRQESARNWTGTSANYGEEDRDR